MESKPSPQDKIAAAALAGAILVAFGFAWFWQLDKPFRYDYDEGVYLQSARMFLAGHPLFEETFSSQPPLYLTLLRVAFSMFGDTVVVGRGVSVFFALSICLLLAKAAWDAIGPWAAPAAIALCGGAVSFFNQARVCQAEMAALGFGVAAIAAVSSSQRAGRFGWQVAAGALMGAALGTKLLVAPFVVPILVMVSLRFGQRPAAVRMVLPAIVVLGSTVAALLVVCAPFGLRDVYVSSVGFRLGARTARLLTLTGRPLLRFSQSEGLLIPIALTGAVALAWRRSPVLVWCGAWIAACAAFLSWHVPLFLHHLVLIVPPLAFTGAAATSFAPFRKWMAPAIVVAISALVLVKGEVSRGVHARFAPSIWARVIVAKDASTEQREAVTKIKELTTRTDLVVTDEQILAFRAGRYTPGELCDTSYVRIGRGSLTTEKATRAASGAKLIVLKNGRLNRLPRFFEWVEEHYDPIPLSTPSAPKRGFYLRREPERARTPF